MYQQIQMLRTKLSRLTALEQPTKLSPEALGREGLIRGDLLVSFGYMQSSQHKDLRCVQAGTATRTFNACRVPAITQTHERIRRGDGLTADVM